MEVTWVVFYYEDKELEAYPLPGIFPGEEIETTLDSIAYDLGISKDAIRVVFEDRVPW